MTCRRLSPIAILAVAALASGCAIGSIGPGPRTPALQTGSSPAPSADQPAPPALCDHDAKVSDCHR